MFKVLVLQRLYGLQDGQTEYQIKDRMSFRQFLGIENVDDVPDQKTIWKFKEILSKNGIIDTLGEFYKLLCSDFVRQIDWLNEGAVRATRIF